MFPSLFWRCKGNIYIFHLRQLQSLHIYCVLPVLTCSSRVLILVLIVFLLDTKSTQWEDPRVQINNKPSQVGTMDKHYWAVRGLLLLFFLLPFSMVEIHLIPKWQPVYCSFVYMVISPLCLVNMYNIQKNFEVKMRQRGLINMQIKE